MQIYFLWMNHCIAGRERRMLAASAFNKILFQRYAPFQKLNLCHVINYRYLAKGSEAEGARFTIKLILYTFQYLDILTSSPSSL